MLTNLYIEKVFKNVKGFLGVFSSNNAIQLKNPGESIIINFDKVGESGSHFIAIFLTSKELLYFDSLNFPIIPISLANYLSHYKKIRDHSKSLQSFKSTFCGFYCMLFIICNVLNEKYAIQILGKMKENDSNNDNKCILYLTHFLKMYFKKEIKV